MLFGDGSDFLDRLDGTDLVVCKHNGDQDGLWCDRFLQFIKADDTVLIYIEVCDLCASFFEVFTCMKDRMMLDLGCDDVVSFGFVCFKSSFECPVVSLASACCEVDFFFLCVQNICDLLSSFGHCFFAFLCKIIDA